MKPLRTFSVIPSLPPSLAPLRELALNLRWAWDHATISLFRRLDSDLWETTGHNPFLMLGRIDQEKLKTAATDEAFLAHLERVYEDFVAYMDGQSSWFRKTYGTCKEPLVAYFSAEFGLTECLSIFAGGLGILAGDHVKSASDLGIPLVGVGLLYQQGYFRQYLNEAGWQQEAYEDNDFSNLPLTLIRDIEGHPLTIEAPIAGRSVTAQIWKIQAGRIPVFLLDTNVDANTAEDRDITDQLYGGDSEMRIRQEIILGIGGYRALEALEFKPVVYHMNEGHSAFLAIEKLNRLMQKHGLAFSEARELATAGLVFTTHTPVAAGHDYFNPALIQRYFGACAHSMNISVKDFMALGRQNPADDKETFCMTVLALRLAACSNGVSRLHGQVSRKMWQALWPEIPEDEVPIGSITNGVHFRSWISYEMNQLYDRYLGPLWREQPADRTTWERAERIPHEELWHIHELRRERLVAFARRCLQAQLAKRGATRSEIEAAGEVLDSEALTIGFARRFATYKRATLLLRDPERLARILNCPGRPVQIIFAGKAHPRDDAGKQLIQQILSLCRQEAFRRRIVFLEDYGMSISRYLVQGADMWLNTPLRPQEASGTSGMKAAANGVLNLSTLDGWWDEAWQQQDNRKESIGWAIGRGETYDTLEQQDQVEAEALYGLLERDVVSTFYDRGADKLPRRWIARMKASIGGLCHYFNTHRMVREYTERFYLQSAERYRNLAADEMIRAKSLAAWRAVVTAAWPQVRVVSLESVSHLGLEVGTTINIRACVQLGALAPDDVAVELYLGQVKASGDIGDTKIIRMKNAGKDQQGRCIFEAGAIPCCKSGLHGYTVRIIPNNDDLPVSFLPGLIHWADPAIKEEIRMPNP